MVETMRGFIKWTSNFSFVTRMYICNAWFEFSLFWRSEHGHSFTFQYPEYGVDYAKPWRTLPMQSLWCRPSTFRPKTRER